MGFFRPDQGPGSTCRVGSDNYGWEDGDFCFFYIFKNIFFIWKHIKIIFLILAYQNYYNFLKKILI
jgi:hypothetical protein